MLCLEEKSGGRGCVLSNLTELQDGEMGLFSQAACPSNIRSHSRSTGRAEGAGHRGKMGIERGSRPWGGGGTGGISQEVPHSWSRIGGQQK